MLLCYHARGFLAVVIGHLQIFLFEPLGNQIKRNPFNLDSVGRKGMAKQVGLNGDRLAAAIGEDHPMQQKAQAGSDGDPVEML